MTTHQEARTQGNQGMQIALDFATRQDADFKEKVLAHIERYARIHAEFTGEDCNEEMVLLGIITRDRKKATGQMYRIAQAEGRQWILQDGHAMKEPGRAVSLASAMGVSEATVSRYKNEQLEGFALFLAHAGLKIVSAERVCVDRETYEALTHIASKAMANTEMARQLVWEDA